MGQLGQVPLRSQDLIATVESASWYAVHTHARHEKRIAQQLALKSINHYLPIVPRFSQWSDRRKLIEVPLFPCYLFVHVVPSPEARIRILQVGGVIAFVGPGRQPTPIPDSQIEDIRTLMKSNVALNPYPFVKIGQRVRIRGGSLDGIEGILVRRNGARRLVISVDSLERSLSICVEGLEIEVV